MNDKQNDLSRRDNTPSNVIDAETLTALATMVMAAPEAVRLLATAKSASQSIDPLKVQITSSWPDEVKEYYFLTFLLSFLLTNQSDHTDSVDGIDVKEFEAELSLNPATIALNTGQPDPSYQSKKRFEIRPLCQQHVHVRFPLSKLYEQSSGEPYEIANFRFRYDLLNETVQRRPDFKTFRIFGLHGSHVSKKGADKS
ncbi:MAG: hypothetical protein ACRBBQ_15885 [Cognatishimia sp.]